MIGSLQCDISQAAAYRSPTQIARVVSESWCSGNLYCAACDASRLKEEPANTKALDFRCLHCSQTYQVKSQKHLNLKRIVDGAYAAMRIAVQRNLAPNLIILNYSSRWTVQNLILVPSLFFTESVLEKRKPLSAAARRAGWTGCNLVLSNVPDEGKIPLVQNAVVVPPSAVRSAYKKYHQLESLGWNLRGWTLDVLRITHKIGTAEFTLDQVYQQEPELITLHPDNRNVRPKIRQQLQILRDMGIIEFMGKGSYRFAHKTAAFPRQ